MKPRLIVEQKITAFANKYSVYAANSDGSKGAMVAFAQQKRLAFKEKVTFYTDQTKQNTIFTFRAEKVLDVHGSYFVEDANGALIGQFKKKFKQSLVRSTWQIVDQKDNSALTVTESNETLAILRRFAGNIPILGGIAELVMLFFKYHFSFIDDATNQEVGKYEKTTLFRDHYCLHMTDEGYASQDWRVLAAVAVALDALQSR